MLVLRRFTLHCCLFVIASMALLTVSGVAQDSSAEKKERDVQRRVGIYLSGQGLADGVDAIGIGSIDFPSEDIMPYPFFFISTRYNKYQATLAFGNDKYGRNEYNESIMRFTARYNYYPFKKILYVSGGLDLWYFNKKFSFTRDVCISGEYIGYIDLYLGCTGESIITEIRTDRPDGKSIIPGMSTSLGIEYTVFNSIVLSHEAEFYFSACSYKEFVCSGSDLKMLGLHFKF